MSDSPINIPVTPPQNESQSDINEDEKDINISKESLDIDSALTPNTPEQTTDNNMEVHYHPHINKKRKHLKEYLLEGCMIFIAVMLGFFAEGYREHLTEKSREREFIKSMIDDLKRDTSNFSFQLANGKITCCNIDTLINLFQVCNDSPVISKMYLVARNITRRAYPFEIFDRTYSQMKTSGNLRLLHSPKISDSITTYYSDIQLLSSQQNFINNFIVNYINEVPEVFDAQIMHKMFKESGMNVVDNKQTNVKHIIPLIPPKGNSSLMSDDPIVRNKFLSSVHYLYARTLNVMVIIGNEKTKAERLISFLSDEYDF